MICETERKTSEGGQPVDFSNIRPAQHRKPFREIQAICCREDRELQKRLERLEREYPPASGDYLSKTIIV